MAARLHREKACAAQAPATSHAGGACMRAPGQLGATCPLSWTPGGRAQVAAVHAAASAAPKLTHSRAPRCSSDQSALNVCLEVATGEPAALPAVPSKAPEQASVRGSLGTAAQATSCTCSKRLIARAYCTPRRGLRRKFATADSITSLQAGPVTRWAPSGPSSNGPISWQCFDPSRQAGRQAGALPGAGRAACDHSLGLASRRFPWHPCRPRLP